MLNHTKFLPPAGSSLQLFTQNLVSIPSAGNITTGHWGLTGMRERAKRMNARINMWSRHAAGTEIELLVPGSAAFDIPAVVIRPWREWLAKLTPGRTKPETGAQS